MARVFYIEHVFQKSRMYVYVFMQIRANKKQNDVIDSVNARLCRDIRFEEKEK